MNKTSIVQCLAIITPCVRLRIPRGVCLSFGASMTNTDGDRYFCLINFIKSYQDLNLWLYERSVCTLPLECFTSYQDMHMSIATENYVPRTLYYNTWKSFLKLFPPYYITMVWFAILTSAQDCPPTGFEKKWH